MLKTKSSTYNKNIVTFAATTIFVMLKWRSWQKDNETSNYYISTWYITANADTKDLNLLLLFLLFIFPMLVQKVELTYEYLVVQSNQVNLTENDSINESLKPKI